MPQRDHTSTDPTAILQWYVEMGVDEAIGDQATDWFTESERQQQTRQAPAAAVTAAKGRPSLLQRDETPGQARPDPSPKPARAEDVVQDARTVAQGCNTLDELKIALANFEGCGLKRTAKNLVFADGSPDAPVMLIGEAPGRDEDLQGVPFVGRSGQLLDRMLAAIGRDRTNTYVTNVIPWRPPGNRTPTPAETAICRAFVERQIALVDPQVIVFLGGVAAKEMLETSTGIMRLRGTWRTYPANGGQYRAMATLHPAYLLRQPAQKKLAWRDFLEVQQALEERVPGTET